MQLVVLIPGLFCIFAILQGGTKRAFLSVFFPVLMMFPTTFFWRAPHLQPLTFIDSVLFPLGLSIIFTNLNKWKFSRADIWMAVFIFTCGYSEGKTWGTSGATMALIGAILEGLIPYMAGKLLIEQGGLRMDTIRSYASWLAVAAIFSMPEYFFKFNAFRRFWIHFFPGQWGGFVTQVRWGFGRLAGPFSQSELAGMIFLTGLLLMIWVRQRKYPDERMPSLSDPTMKRSKLIYFILLITLVMTQARGPWLGTIVALGIASIGKARQPLRRAVLIVSLGLMIGIPTYVLGKAYISGPRTDFGSERETAQYRAELIDNYLPIAQLGGAWGWGKMFPRIGGQDSVDNEYLFLYLSQGYVGAIMFILIITEASIALIRVGLKSGTMRERHFIFTLLGIILGIAFTLTTVFLGAQSHEVFFLLLGWAQSVRATRRNEAGLQEVRVPLEFAEPVGMRVFT